MIPQYAVFMRNKIQHINNTVILLVGVMVFFFNTQHLCAQKKSILDTTISYKAKNITLYESLQEISEIINHEFSYNADLIASNSEIKVSFEQTVLRNLLNDLLNDSTLAFQAVEKQIIIRKKNLLNTLSVKNTYEGKHNLTIKGSIYNWETKESLPFANIAIKGKSSGTVSNEKGDFVFKISEQNISDTLVISYIGYKNTYIPINQLSLFNNRFYLQEDQYKIQEVIIRTNNPLDILRKSLEKSKVNYYTDPYYITSFYREIVTSQDDLAAISEAVIQVYKSPYWGLFSDQIKVLKSRKNQYYSHEDTLSLKLKGGLYSSLYLDMIKNPSVFLDPEFFHNFNYYIDDIVRFDEATAYVIKFNPRYYLEDNSFEGKIFINTNNLAIVAIEFNITEDAIDKMGSNLIVKKSFGTRVNPVSAKYLVNYRKINNKYFLNLVKGELHFKVKYRRKLFARDYKTVFEFASNNIDTLDVNRFERVETISSQKVFIDENFQYDHDFWGQYNYISPDETLQEALIRIQKRMNEMGKDE